MVWNVWNWSTVWKRHPEKDDLHIYTVKPGRENVLNTSKLHDDALQEWMNERRNQDGVVRSLTGHSVDCFERPQDPHCSDGCQVDILQVQRVFNHPGETHRSSSLASWPLQRAYSLTDWLPAQTFPIFVLICPLRACCDCIWRLLFDGPLPSFFCRSTRGLTQSEACCATNNMN